MSLIITKKFKRTKAQDAIPLHSSYSDPWWVEEAGKTVQALRNGGFPRKSIEELYAKIGRYTIGGGIPKLHGLAEKLNDLKYAVENNGNEGYKARQKAIGVAQEIMRVKTADSRAEDANFKVGDTVRVDASYSRNVNNGIGKVVKVDGSSDIVVEFARHGTVRVPVSYATLVNSHATDYDPNPQTRGKDIEFFSAQAIREESACENVLRKVIEDVEALVIKIHGPMSSWEEVIENSEMSPELPQAKKWSATANRRYDYLLARERAISSILSELKRNHID